MLKVNSPVFADDRIITGDDGSVSIVFDTSTNIQLDLGRMSNVVIDEDVYGVVSPSVSAEASAEQEAIQKALLAGDQPLELDATAAGTEANAGGGHPVFIVTPDWAAVTPESGAETRGITWGGEEAKIYPQNSIPTITADSGNAVVRIRSCPGFQCGRQYRVYLTAHLPYLIRTVWTISRVSRSMARRLPLEAWWAQKSTAPTAPLTITAYDNTTGVANYTYELKSPTTDGPGPETDVFTLTTTDASGATSAPAAINIEIVDDVPHAVDDFNTIAEDSTAPITGNVLPNDVHPNGQPGADTPTSFVSWTTTTAQYGTFTDLGNGNYSYTLDNTNPAVQALNDGQTLVEKFPYWMQDADDDQATAVLTIIITGANEVPIVAPPPPPPPPPPVVPPLVASDSEALVNEAGLASGSNAASNSEIYNGQIAPSGGAGGYLYLWTLPLWAPTGIWFCTRMAPTPIR